MEKPALFIDGPYAGTVSTVSVGIDKKAPSEIRMPGIQLSYISSYQDPDLRDEILSMRMAPPPRVLSYGRLAGVYPFFICYSMSQEYHVYELAIKLIESAIQQDKAETADKITKKFTQRVTLLESRLNEISKAMTAMKFLTDIADAIRNDQ